MPEVVTAALTVPVDHATFDEWWTPFTPGVGPAGAHVARIDGSSRAELRERCRELLPDAPFATKAVAWTAWTRKPAR